MENPTLEQVDVPQRDLQPMGSPTLEQGENVIRKEQYHKAYFPDTLCHFETRGKEEVIEKFGMKE